jgi:hypothetical protein
MAIQMYLVQLRSAENDHDREMIADYIAHLDGFILMATSAGSLIVAFDDRYAERVKAHHLVDFVGGVSINPDGPLLEHLQRLFAQNVAAQLAERVPSSSAAPVENSHGTRDRQPGFSPGYRPLRWPKS